MDGGKHAGCRCAYCSNQEDISGSRFRCLNCDLDFCSAHVAQHDGYHTVIPFHFPPYSESSSTEATDLSGLIASIFDRYQDRPCIGIANAQTPSWTWMSFADVWHMSLCYRADFQPAKPGSIVIISFLRNSVELIACDIAAALCGLCSVIASSPEEVPRLRAMLGTDCMVVSGPALSNRHACISPAYEGNGPLFTLFCTSGSTGIPKLVRRSRGAWLDTVSGTVEFGAHLCITLLFASLSHSGPRTELWWNLACGGQTALSSDLPLLPLLTALSPTEVAAPPGVWAELRRAFQAEAVTEPGRLKKKFPGLVKRLQSVSTGAARCGEDLFTFMTKLFGPEVSISDNYGTTEVGSIATDGIINWNVTAKLVDIPELGIFSPKGEICVKCEFEGYWDSRASAAAMTKDGFYRTGDIGEEVCGKIRILGRSAGVVKLANGKFCSLEAVEEQILSTPGVEQACAFEFEGALVAVVYAPNLMSPIHVPHVRSSQHFSVSNGMLTPSLKLCREAVREAHLAELQQLVYRSSKVNEWLQAQLKGLAHDLEEDMPLSSLGITSLQIAQLAAELGVPVHVVACAKCLKDLQKLSSHETGVDMARADFEAFCALNGGTSAPRKVADWKKLLVTGATGHIGKHFVKMLKDKGFEIVEASRTLGMDVSNPRFGLSEYAYKELSLSCDAVIHCAAIVNWTCSYTFLRKSNVESVINVVRFCGQPDLPWTKPLLMIGSGASFPECPATLEWLDDCVNPYMVSKITAEALVHRMCKDAVVVRPGLVVWNSTTGEYNATDAQSRMMQAICLENLAWTTDSEDGFLDGVNVDTFCEAAFHLFCCGGPAVYNLNGCYPLAAVVQALDESIHCEPYADWLSVMKQRCKENPLHPLAALMPHILDGPLLAGKCLSKKCADALGPRLAGRVAQAEGFEAFAAAMIRSDSDVKVS